MAERVRSAVANTVVTLEGGNSVVMTVSIGVAAVDRMPTAIAPFIAEADKALYAAKAAGRNRVIRAA